MFYVFNFRFLCLIHYQQVNDQIERYFYFHFFQFFALSRDEHHIINKWIDLCTSKV